MENNQASVSKQETLTLHRKSKNKNMEVPNQEDHEMPIPLNTRMIHHDPTSHTHNIAIPYSCPQIVPSNSPIISSSPDHDVKKRVTIKYKECMKNHAIAMGGNATDGCGEFLPNGEEGTIEALSCSACHCHRNFHRKESCGADDQPSSENYYCHDNESDPRIGRKALFMGHQNKEFLERNALEHQAGTLISSRTFARVPHRMGCPVVPPESDEQEEHGGNGSRYGPVAARPIQVVKKRFRTKFTQEQKEKMQDFAEKVGWKIQKLEESVVQRFCQEVGVKRRVLRVWMHNNKHNFAKKNHQPDAQN